MHFNIQPGRSIFKVLAVACVLISQPALATGTPFELIETELVRSYLEGAPGTLDFMSSFVGKRGLSKEQLLKLTQAKLERPEFAAERSAIEERLRQVQERFNRIRSENSPERPLTREQKIWLNQAANHLRINPAWRPGQLNGEIEFFARSPAENLEGTRAAFLRRAPDPAFAADPSSVPVAERLAAEKRFRFDMAEMKNCVAQRPPSEKLDFNFKYLMTQLVTDEAMTVGGAIVAAGGMDGVDWRTLPNDLAFEAMASMGDSLIATMPNPAAAKIDVRWYIMQTFGLAQSTTDAVIYSISRSHSVSTGKRFLFNTAWNAPYSKASILLYDVIAGMECLGASPAIVLGTQVAAGLGANIAYFGLRNLSLGKNSR